MECENFGKDLRNREKRFILRYVYDHTAAWALVDNILDIIIVTR